MTRYCPDTCKYLEHDVWRRGRCRLFGRKYLKDYDMNASLIKYIKLALCKQAAKKVRG